MNAGMIVDMILQGHANANVYTYSTFMKKKLQLKKTKYS